MLLKLPHLFIPRDYQLELMRAVFVDKYKHICWIVHRRAGKTLTSVNILFMMALKEPGLYLYLLPLQTQARKVIWRAMGSDGVRFLDYIPSSLVKKVNQSEMILELMNGSVIQFVGSNNYDSLVGTNPRALFYDEFSISNPLCRDFLSPILLENQGTEIIFGTPRAKNHLYDVYNMALDNPKWFVRKLGIEDTARANGSRIVTQEQIEEEKKSGKSIELINQEYYCSFEAGNQGAYYTAEMNQAENENRIYDIEINVNAPVYCAIDIGVHDATTAVLWQAQGDQIFFIYAFELVNKGVQDLKEELDNIKLRLRFRKYGLMWAPHDISVREWSSSARSRLTIARELGLHFQMVPKVSVQDRIQAGRAFLRDCHFHKTNCKHLIRCLKEWQREYDNVNLIFKDKPLHNYASDTADAFTYAAVGWREQFAMPQMNTPSTYRMETSF